MALEQYSPALFDTIQWASDSSQTNRGGVVWAFSCKKCHGQLGKGDAGMVLNGDTLRPPDFTTQWRFGSDTQALIKAIYAGNEAGMPHWGISGLKPRDISAVAAYVEKNIVGLGTNEVQTPTTDSVAH
jgi:mono/diheme cytochrome c family protein